MEVIRTVRNLLGKQAAADMPFVGSSPTASAENIWGHGPTGRRQLRTLEIRVRLSVTPLEKYGPVVQWQRHLVHTQETMVQLHPGPLWPRYANLAERLGLNPSVCGFDSRSGHLRLGRQPADHLGLEPGMLWVRLPPEPLEHEHALVEQPGVLACLSRRRSRVQIPSRALGKWRGTQTGKAAKLKPW